jgi:tRNA1(Val) A37 N6-methylase TrmN6
MNVLDPCAGYSSRLIGFYTCARGGNYYGIDPCKKTYDGLLQTQKDLQSMVSNHKAFFYNERAEFLMPTLNESYDLIFTSPPYFNLEKYSDESSQSYKMYEKYEEWLDKFLFVIIKESHRLLKEDGTFLLNIADCNSYKLVEHTEMFLKKMFRIEKVLIMLAPSQFEDCFAEPVFVLKKI